MDKQGKKHSKDIMYNCSALDKFPKCTNQLSDRIALVVWNRVE